MKSSKPPATSSTHHLSVAQLEKLCYRLGVSLRAGVPVVQAWKNEAASLRGRTRDAFHRVGSQLRAGTSLSDALANEACFPALLTEMARVGEETGQLDRAFLRLAEHYRALVKMKRTFLQAVTWPLLQLSAAAAIVSGFFVLLYVLERRFSGLRAPDIFQLGLSPLGNLLVFWGVLLGTAALVWGGTWLVRRGAIGSLPMRIALATPLLGSTIQSLALSRFAWSFGTAVDAGMDAQQAIRLGLRSTQNSYYLSREEQIAAAVAEGRDFHSALEESNAFPPDLLQAVQLGEVSGELTESLERLSDDYSEQSALNLRRISQISGFGIFVTVSGLLACTVMLMYAGYLGTLNAALQGQSVTLEEIRSGQLQTDNPVIAAKNEMVKDFVENNEDFKQIESLYKHLGRYNEMTPDEFLDSIPGIDNKPPAREP